MRTARVTISMTETEAFRRLVAFLQEVEEYADEQCDIALKELVEGARSDLLRLRGGD